MEEKAEEKKENIEINYPCFPELEMRKEIPESEKMDEKEIQELLNKTAPDDDY